MGHFHDPSGAFLEVQTPTAPFFFSAHQDSKLQREAQDSSTIRSDASSSAGSSTSSGIGKILRLLFPSLLGTQKVRGMETCSRSEAVEQVYPPRTVQDGISEHSHPKCATRGLDGLYRPPGCVSACTNTSRLPVVPKVQDRGTSPTVPVFALRHINSPQNLYQSVGGNPGASPGERDPCVTLPGRYSSPISEQGSPKKPCSTSHGHADETRMANQSCKEPAHPGSKDDIFRGTVRYTEEGSVTPAGENPYNHRESKEGSREQIHVGFGMSESPGNLFLMHPNGEVGPVASPWLSTGFSIPVEEEVPFSGNIDHNVNEVQPVVVDETTQPSKSLPSWPHLMDHTYIRCKSIGLGCPLQGSVDPRKMAVQRGGCSIQHSGTKGSLEGYITLGTSSQGQLPPTTNGQQSGGGLRSKPRGNPQQIVVPRGSPDLGMGRGEPCKPQSDLPASPPESFGRSPVQGIHQQQRMVPGQWGVSVDLSTVGQSSVGPVCIPTECQNTSFFHKMPCPGVSGSRCLSSAMVLPSRVRVPSYPTDSQIPSAPNRGGSDHPGSDSLLAEEALVHAVDPAVSLQPSSPPEDAQPSVSRSPHPPTSRDPGSEGLEVERKRLEELGCSHNVIQTLLQARKSSTNSAYYRVWQKFSEFAELNQFNPLKPGVQDILLFLQKGLDLGLGLNTLKVQVSALSALTDIRWALHPLIERFLKAVLRLRPPRKTLYPKWDLPLVLNTLAAPPFAPTEDCALENITLKAAFLVAVTSGRRVSEIQALGAQDPYITFFPDRVVLQPIHQFIPKVPTAYHFNQEWVLPAFEEDPATSKLHELDVARTLRRYIDLTQSFRKDQRLFVIPNGGRKGLAASKRTIASWIVRLIQRAYRASGLPVPKAINAHSTRGISSSWAALAQVSPETICRAASWSSFNTFMVHYSLDPAALTSRDFGKKTLQFSVL